MLENSQPRQLFAVTDELFDIAVVGGGPAGYAAAIRAAQLGLEAVCIEREHLGGTCLNWGCIPTKALLRCAETYHLINHLEEYGLTAENPAVDISALVKRSRKTAARLNAGIRHLLEKNSIPVIEGEARLQGRGKLAVTEKDGGARTVAARNIILATGARARETRDLRADGNCIWTCKEAMTPDFIPESLLVLGAGAIGMEFASFYSDLGSKVSVVEIQDRILPTEDADVSALAARIFSRQGMRLMTSASVAAMDAGKNEVKVSVKRGNRRSALTVDRVILAIGITGNVENLGLEELGVKIEGGHVATDEWGRTGIENIWAVGDLTGAPWLAHKASHEAVAAVEKIAGVEGVRPLEKLNIPACTYCRPQIASVGLTAKAALQQGYKLKTGNFPFSANGRALASGATEGFVKTIFCAATGALLGAHMIGAEVTELIQGFAIAKSLEATEAEIMHTVFPHPTLSEAMHESALDAFGKAIHI